MIKTVKISNKELNIKLLKLIELIESYKNVVIGFSGGIDSTLLTFISHNILAQKSLAVTVDSDFYPKSELSKTISLAKKFALNHIIINLDLFDNQQIIENSPLRCKYCKKVIFESLIDLAKENKVNQILDGSNLDDFEDYRPGFESVQELKIKSPFIESGFSKRDIRDLARIFKLPNWNEPAQACLASRIPYNTLITHEILHKIEKSEDFLRNLGYKGCRVRHHNEIARIELQQEDMINFITNHKEQIYSEIKKIGYKYVCMDINGYNKGSLNLLKE